MKGRELILTYPLTLTEDPETGQVMATFPDVPEAMTVGKDSSDALHWALDALIVAFSGYMDQGRQIPVPSTTPSSLPAITLPALVSAKLALYEAMRRQRMTQVALAQKLGIDPKQVRRLLDLAHNSRID